MDNPYEGMGGTYQVDPATGKITQIVPPTQDHPEGNAPRPAPEPAVEGEKEEN